MRKVKNSNLYIISENEIKLKNAGSSHPRSVCPVCAEQREHPNDPSVSWNFALGVGYCHHCHSGFRIDNDPDTFEKSYGVADRSKKKTPPAKGSMEASNDYRSHLLPLDDDCKCYLKQRGISSETAIAAGVCSRKLWKGSFWQSWVAFPYFVKNRIANVQYKLADIDDKKFFLETNGDIVPWNINCIDEDRGWEPLYITEGMMDALALMECGCSYVVSVPNGADSRMDCFSRFRDKIYRKFRYLVFAGDTDEAGMSLRRKVCAFFAEKDVVCVDWRWRTACGKDADEVLMKYGRRTLRDMLNAAETYDSDFVTVAGDDESAIRNLYRNGIPKGLGIGLEGFDEIVHFEPGNLLLVTGYPGAGKSTLVNYIVTRLLCMYNWRTLFFSPEKQPEHFHEEEIISILSGKRFDSSTLPAEEFERTLAMLSQNMVFIKEEISSLDVILHITERMVRVRGISILVIDPFVYLDMPSIPGASETQKIAEMLKKIIIATRRLNLVTILVAHPRKPTGDGPAEPSLYEVAGSANFYNFCDAGIIMERLKGSRNLVKVTCGKARREFNGCPGYCNLAFDVSCGRYAPCIRDKTGRFTRDFVPYDQEGWFFESPLSPDEGDVTEGQHDDDASDDDASDDDALNDNASDDDASDDDASDDDASDDDASDDDALNDDASDDDGTPQQEGTGPTGSEGSSDGNPVQGTLGLDVPITEYNDPNEV